MENLYPNTLYHVWVAAKSRRGEGVATPKLGVATQKVEVATLFFRGETEGDFFISSI